MPSRFGLIFVLLAGVLDLSGQSPGSLNLYVKEPAGIRRTGYPVNARVPFPKGVLASPSAARLVSSDTEVPAQFSGESQWPDGSVQWLDIDFNASLGPLQSHTYRVEYGSSVHAAAIPRGLAVAEEADAIQVGSVKLSKSGGPLLMSVKYRSEDIAPGHNGFAITASGRKSYDLGGAKMEIVKRGPLYVVLRYSGKVSIDSEYTVPYAITVEMPNSKSWVKASATVEDPRRRLTGLGFHSPLALGAFPWVWDFGTDRWTYGSLKAGTESVSLRQFLKMPGTTDWSIATGVTGQEQVAEAGSLEESKLVRWGHIQDAKEVIAFGIEVPARQPGEARITIGGDGQASFQFQPTTPVTQHRLTVYQHFVSTPVQIGAVTTASSMLSPLTASCDRKQYTLSGVEPPANAVDQ